MEASATLLCQFGKHVVENDGIDSLMSKRRVNSVSDTVEDGVVCARVGVALQGRGLECERATRAFAVDGD